jgi:hypothetical protein
MIWKTFWDAPQGDGTLPWFAPRTILSNLDRLSYIEDAPTISTTLVAAFVLPDFPSTSSNTAHHWLSPIEVRLAEKRMEANACIRFPGMFTIVGGSHDARLPPAVVTRGATHGVHRATPDDAFGWWSTDW